MTASLDVPVADGHLAVLDLRPDAPGTPLVLLHGGAVDHRMWGPQLEAFGDRRVVAIDARGHGRSSTPSAPFRHCDDTVEVLDHLDIDAAVLVGLSMGGSTAVDVALEHPARAAGLVVSGTGTSEPDWTEPWVLGIQQRWVETATAGDADGWIAAFMEFVPGEHRTRDQVDPSVWDLIETMARDVLANHVPLDEHGTPTAPVLPTPVTRTWERLPRITAPVAAVCGSLDGVDHHRFARRLAESVEHGTFTTIDGTAHYPNLERADEFDAVVRDLLARV